MKKLICVAVSPFLLCASVLAQTPPSQKLALPDALKQAVAHLPAGGAVAAEAENGRVRYYSAGDPGAGGSIRPEKLIFEIGSITKVFTSLLLAEAVVEHKAALNDPIGLYLPPALRMDPRTAAITLEQLATHTAGLPRMPDNFDPQNPSDPYADYTVRSLYAFLADYRATKRLPARAEYSNVGAALLGHVLEMVFHGHYGNLIAAKIGRPLGLADTVTDLNSEQETRFALPHEGMIPATWHVRVFVGAGGLYSTASDLTRFAQLMMTPAQNPLRDAWELVRQPRYDFLGGKVGLGVLIRPHGTDPTYWHNGATGGTRSYLEWTPQPSRHVLVILANTDALDLDAFAASLGIGK